MQNGHFKRVSLASLLGLAIFPYGCIINVGSRPMRAKCQRTVRLSASLSSGSTFTTQTHNCSITINGAPRLRWDELAPAKAEVTDCNIVATITARAETDEEARELAEKIEITLEPLGDGLTAKIKRPTLLVNKSVSVSLDVTVPNQTDLELGTHNGSIVVADISGRINATTHNGEVATERFSGTAVLETHNGPITCRETSGDAKLKTHNGSIKAFYCEAAPAVSDISIISHNGSIELTASPGLSARIDASTHNGSINTDLPITVRGKGTKKRLTGAIGSGEGKLYLETHNGSIRLR